MINDFITNLNPHLLMLKYEIRKKYGLYKRQNVDVVDAGRRDSDAICIHTVRLIFTYPKAASCGFFIAQSFVAFSKKVICFSYIYFIL